MFIVHVSNFGVFIKIQVIFCLFDEYGIGKRIACYGRVYLQQNKTWLTVTWLSMPIMIPLKQAMMSVYVRNGSIFGKIIFYPLAEVNRSKISRNGVLLWRIPEFTKCLAKIGDETVPCVYSCPILQNMYTG